MRSSAVCVDRSSVDRSSVALVAICAGHASISRQSATKAGIRSPNDTHWRHILILQAPFFPVLEISKIPGISPFAVGSELGGNAVQMDSNQLLQAAYDHFNARELDAVLALMTPDVHWPNGMEGGWVEGREGVRDYWTRQWAILDPHVDPVTFRDEADGRTVSVHQVVHDKEGVLLADQIVEHVYRIQSGLIQNMEIRVLQT
jgi:hypothetical protein